jgi:cellulose synthase operon protein C
MITMRRRLGLAAVLVCASACGGAPPGPAARPGQGAATGTTKESPQTLGAQGRKALDRSEYAKAEKLLTEAAARGQRGAPELDLAVVFLRTGRHAQALKTAAAVEPASPELQERQAVVMAGALRRQGKLAEAEQTLRRVEKLPLAREARLLLGEVLIQSGRRADAREPLLSLIEDYNEDRIKDDQAHEMALIGRAAHHLRSPRDANDAFNTAERGGDKDRDLLLWRAELFLDKYDPGHAEEVLGELLEQAPNDPEALVGMAHVRLDQAFDFDEAERLARRALAQNPNLPEAYFVLAGIALRDMELELAEQHVKAALAINPRDLQTLSMAATVRFLAEDQPGFARIKKQVFELNREYSRFYAIVGEYADWEHRYDEIVAMMEEAVVLDAEDAVAGASLGINLIRANREQDGARALARAFALDPYNVRVFNTLNLYEKVIPASYVSVPGARFTIRYHSADKPVLERYVPQLLEQAWAELVAHYGFTPQVPVGVELYAERENFAIRTTGLPETAIQGVCFGKTLASMSPQNERFNLGMTLWHELAHVFHIQLSKSRVPRWFTEGLAEYETLVVRPEWAREHDPDLYEMKRAGRLPTLGKMSRAFTRAEQLSDVATAYYASSQIVVDLAQRHGIGKLAQMLRGWGQGLPTAEVFKQSLGETTEQADSRFASGLERRFQRYRGQFVPSERAPALAAAQEAVKKQPKSAKAALELTLALLREGDPEKAVASLKRARALDPKLPDARYLEAKLELLQDRPKPAIKLLRSLAADGGEGYGVQLLLAEAARAAQDPVLVREALEAAHVHDPSQAEPLYGLLALNEADANVDRELELLRKLGALAEHDAELQRRLLARLVERGLWPEALKAGERALHADVMGLETHLFYAQALDASGDRARALFEAESATLCPNENKARAEAHAYYAELLLAAGKRRVAKEQGKKALALDPDNTRLKTLKL